MNGIALSPAAELVRMIEPPPLAITWGAVSTTVFHTPVRLMSIVSRQISSVTLSHAFIRPTPALATTMSSRPNASTPRRAASARAGRSRTSALAVTIRPPAASTSRAVSASSASVLPS